MTPYEDHYAAFMMDYAAGALSPAETLAIRAHLALSKEGAGRAALLEAAGGAMLEALAPAAMTGAPADVSKAAPRTYGRSDADTLDWLVSGDLSKARWRRGLFGVDMAKTKLAGARLMRLAPGERAPHHDHARSDITVVLRGRFADEFAVYETGDLAFSERGVVHQPRAEGGETCYCLIANDSSRFAFFKRTMKA